MKINKEIIVTQITTLEYIEKFRDVAKFIEFCKNCNNYNRMWSCPPFNTNCNANCNDSTVICKANNIEAFDLLTVIGVKINLDEDIRYKPSNNDERNEMIREILSEVRTAVDKEMLALEHQIQPSLAYFGGSCRLCAPNQCRRIDNEPCCHPDKMRSTLEAIGFDMGRTTSELLGIELKWCEGCELPPYFTLVYGLLTNCSVLEQVEDRLSGIIRSPLNKN